MYILKLSGADEEIRTPDLLITNHCTQKSMHGSDSACALIINKLPLNHLHYPWLDSSHRKTKRNFLTSDDSPQNSRKTVLPSERLRE